jgi:lantibiotic biosynthesis dehydratase-like protein
MGFDDVERGDVPIGTTTSVPLAVLPADCLQDATEGAKAAGQVTGHLPGQPPGHTPGRGAEPASPHPNIATAAAAATPVPTGGSTDVPTDDSTTHPVPTAPALDPSTPEYRALRREFVAAGLAALDRSRAADTRRTRWVRVGVTPAAGADARLYGRLEEVACELLGTGAAADFFFVHKAPGLRIRFALHGDAATAARLRELVYARAEEWLRDGLVAHTEAGVYEPEEHLFGGPVSMRSVHRLFTVDSLAWLGFHASDEKSLPAWRSRWS